MHQFLESHSEFTYHYLDVEIVCLKPTVVDAWLGIIIRNNFLYAAEQVYVKEQEQSLRTLLQIPLPPSHPLYKTMKGMFPSPFLISLNSHNYIQKSTYNLCRGEVISFRITLLGSYIQYASHALEAINKMCERGFGNPMIPLVPLTNNGNQQVFIKQQFVEFLSSTKMNCNLLCIHYVTPLVLFKPIYNKDTHELYRNPLNGFPSFHQLILSLSRRLAKLKLLYSSMQTSQPLTESNFENLLEDYIDDAQTCILKDAQLKYITLHGGSREGKHPLKFSGYVGQLTFEGNFSNYLPLLLFMQNVGVGTGIVYGMGRYKLDVKIKR